MLCHLLEDVVCGALMHPGTFLGKGVGPSVPDGQSELLAFQAGEVLVGLNLGHFLDVACKWVAEGALRHGTEDVGGPKEVQHALLVEHDD